MKKTKTVTIEATFTEGKIDLKVTGENSDFADVLYTCSSVDKGMRMDATEEVKKDMGEMLDILPKEMAEGMVKRAELASYNKIIQEQEAQYDEVSIELALKN